MDAITLSVVIGEDRRLVINLPDTIPTGLVELVIRPVQPVDRAALHAEREAARQKLLAAGLLATDLGIPDDLEPYSDEELEQIVLPPGARPSEELIDEDRGLY
ncbi:MAG: hypothetical protein JXB47_09525 [Anaerolineae bacterium]|nr:hypothetical protein [Anaerolineae bacterium]